MTQSIINCMRAQDWSQAETFSLGEELHTKGLDVVVKTPKREGVKNLGIMATNYLKIFAVYILM